MLAEKIKCLKQLEKSEQLDTLEIETLRKHLNALKKLERIFKKPSTFAQQSELLRKLTEMCRSQAHPTIKMLQIPQNLLCTITGDFMKEPVLIESGMTYEKSMIQQCFKLQAAQADIDKKELGDEFDESSRESYIKCPATYKVVKPSMLIPNKRIKQATEVFMAKNKWAIDFDPRQTYRNIKLWQ